MISDATLNGIAILRGDILEPYQGAWTADLELLSDGIDEPLNGAATLSLLGETWAGTVAHAPGQQTDALSGPSGGFLMARIVGGGGGMQTAVQPKEWPQGVLVQQVLADLLQLAGETQSPEIAPQLLARLLPQWSYPAGSVDSALSALAAYLGCVWRIRRDGLVWLGVPTPTPATAPDYIIADVAPEAGMVGWDLNDVSVRVDDIVDGLTIRVINWVFTSDSLRAVITYAPGPAAALFALFDQWLRRVGYPFTRCQPGRIAAQNADNTVQFQPDDSTIAPMRRVGIRVGLPDTTVQINPSSRAVSCWEAGQPTGPVLQSFGDSTASKIKIGKSATLGAQPTIKGTSFRNAQATMDANAAAFLISAAAAATAAAAAMTSLVAVAPGPEKPFFTAAATAFTNMALALGSTGAAKAFTDFETAAAGANNFLTQIVEVG